MKVSELIELLKEYDPNTPVLISSEFGKDEFSPSDMNLEIMDYVKYPPTTTENPIPYGVWEYPYMRMSTQKRDFIFKGREVLVIGI